MSNVRLSELIGKDIVNIMNGSRLGTVADSDLMVDMETGEIESRILPSRSGFFSLWDHSNLTVPWSSIRKIGSEVIIVELDDSHEKYRGFSY